MKKESDTNIVSIEWANGEYTGEISDGVPHGKGMWTDGRMQQVGHWKNAKLWHGAQHAMDETGTGTFSEDVKNLIYRQGAPISFKAVGVGEEEEVSRDEVTQSRWEPLDLPERPVEENIIVPLGTLDKGEKISEEQYDGQAIEYYGQNPGEAAAESDWD